MVLIKKLEMIFIIILNPIFILHNLHKITNKIKKIIQVNNHKNLISR
jgi:hypothetical protein